MLSPTAFLPTRAKICQICYDFLRKIINFLPMAKMSKSQILATMADNTGLSKKDVKNFMDQLMELAYKEVKQNGEFVLPGMGKMVKINRPARQGRNPATGATIQIPAKVVLKFRVAKAAKDALL